MPAAKLTTTTVTVLGVVAKGHRHGFDIMDATGLPSGTVYPILGRLEDRGYLRSSWEDQAVAQGRRRPPRRYYEITPTGKVALGEALRGLQELQELAGPDAAAKPARSR